MEEDDARRLVAERGLAAAAFGHLTEAFLTLPFEALGPVKTLLKRYLSASAWSAEDADALAAALGPGEGAWHRDLDDELTLDFGWDAGRFRVRVAGAGAAAGGDAGVDPLAATFDGPVVPEATPNPRTIRFGFGHPIHTGPSRWYESATAAADDPPAARLFADFDAVTNVLVGPDFVAVGLRRPGDWETLLADVLAVVTEEFADPDAGTPAQPTGAAGGPAWLSGRPSPAGDDNRRLTRLELAWRDLGRLRPADPRDLAALLAATEDNDQSRRQVAANLLREADPVVALDRWTALLADPARPVRRATVDAMVDAGREELRLLLETSLSDSDAWVRWKALRGLAELGPGPSRTAIAAKAEDPDFRVRLEAAAALRPPA
jgi:hypothetical protein